MSGADPAVQEALRWLRFSLEDLEAARVLLASDRSVARHVCGLAQQAAEKALKAAIIFEGMEFPYTHDLDVLRNLIPDGWSIKRTYLDLSELADWGVEGRYPGDWPEPSSDEALRAESDATGVYESIASEIRLRSGPS